MVMLHVDPVQFAALREKLASGEFAREPARQFVQRVAQKLRAEIVIRTPVDTGRLRASIAVESQDDGLTAIVGTNVKYAPHVEFGTRPHWPPIAALQPWASRHGFGKGRQGAGRVASIIARRGTRPKRMFREGVAASEPFIEAESAIMLQEMGRRFSE